MRKIWLLFVLSLCLVGLGACADRQVEIKPKGEMVIGVGVGK